MKKLAMLCAGTALCAALLAGCGTTEDQEPAISSDSTTITSQIQNQAEEIVESANAAPDNTQAQSGDTIDEDRAAEIARSAANATDGIITRNYLKMDNGVRVYQVELVWDGVKYEFEIDASTGAIREQSQEQVATGDATSGITAAEAEQVARDAVKLTGGTVVQNQLDTDDGRQIYEIEIVKDTVEYSFEIDAETGTILEQSRETKD